MYGLKKKPEEVEVSGQVLGMEKRVISRQGTSNHVNLPARWKRFFVEPLLELRLVKDDDGDVCILITKPEKESEKQ